jgi:hypothetical protein
MQEALANDPGPGLTRDFILDTLAETRDA